MTLDWRRPLRLSSEWIDSRSVRERGALLAAAIAVGVTGWSVFLMDPVTSQLADAHTEAAQVEQQLRQLETRGQEILEAHIHDENVMLRERAQQLQQQIEGVDAQIHEHTVTMISPPEMARFLEKLLDENGALTLEHLENVGAEPLLDPGGAKEGDEGAWTGVYKHSFEVVLRGRYLDTLAYLRALEALPWNFFWESLEFEVLEHPEGRATIRAYTLSSGEEWIGA